MSHITAIVAENICHFGSEWLSHPFSPDLNTYDFNLFDPLKKSASNKGLLREVHWEQMSKNSLQRFLCWEKQALNLGKILSRFIKKKTFPFFIELHLYMYKNLWHKTWD